MNKDFHLRRIGRWCEGCGGCCTDSSLIYIISWRGSCSVIDVCLPAAVVGRAPGVEIRKLFLIRGRNNSRTQRGAKPFFGDWRRSELAAVIYRSVCTSPRVTRATPLLQSRAGNMFNAADKSAICRDDLESFWQRLASDWQTDADVKTCFPALFGQLKR